jgi:hypothetical protein
MIVGLNRVFAHAGKEYHIQVEDLGVEVGAFEVRVYDGGTVVWRKRIGYADLLAQGLGREEREEQLRTTMDKTLHTVEAAIAKGKLQLQ